MISNNKKYQIMGLYLNPPFVSARGKANDLLNNISGATELTGGTPKEWQPNMVCVVENGLWDAALWVENKEEFERVIRGIHHGDDRPKRWLIVPDAEKYIL